ncbi:MAG: penicillin-binding protein 1A [Armatimonadetes bacterium]|nr:penicillin-binding protein 1A [Armatimonadota bacterium]
MRRRSGSCLGCLGKLFLVALVGILTICGVAAGVLYRCARDLPSVDSLNRYQPSESTKIFAADGRMIGSIYEENRTWVPVTEIPRHMISATIAIEDARFHRHHGIDLKGIARALRANWRGERVTQGGSTITQQLARNLFLTQKVTIDRKIREALLAFQIERKFSKEEIIELYLNQIYYGAASYGVEGAAQTYFGKHAKNLTLPEAAMLAGLPQAPSVYSPFVNLEAALGRQHTVLSKMHEQGFITRETLEEALETKLHYKGKPTGFHGYQVPFFTLYVVSQLFEKFDPDLIYKGGLKVYTTVDLRLQEIAQDALQRGVDQGLSEGLNSHQGALVAIEPRTGFIKAMVGGYRFSPKNQFNRAWQARRQPGSAFKIFVYTAAVDSGYTPDTMVVDCPISFTMGPGDVWAPRNADGRFWGAMPVRDALKWSRNCVAVSLASKIGIDKVIEYAHKLGIKDNMERHLSLSLGAAVVTPLDMATAVATLANEGIKIEPTPFKIIKDVHGNIIENHLFPQAHEVVSAYTALTMTTMLRGVIESGTGTRAQIGRPAAGKTGTTSDFRDAWFVGYTPDMAASVWMGNDDYTPMNYSFGGHMPAAIWAEFMKQALANTPKNEFGRPGHATISVSLCRDSRKLANPSCPKTMTVTLNRDQAPRAHCHIHGKPPPPDFRNEAPVYAPTPSTRPAAPERPNAPPPAPKAPAAPPPAPVETPSPPPDQGEPTGEDEIPKGDNRI